MIHQILENKVLTKINKKKDRRSSSLEFWETIVRINQI
jgi:hypothetical protein